MSPVTYHLSPMPTARDPLPANSTEMFDWWNQPKYQTKKSPKQNKTEYITFAILAICSLTKFLHSMQCQVLDDGTNTQTDKHCN